MIPEIYLQSIRKGAAIGICEKHEWFAGKKIKDFNKFATENNLLIVYASWHPNPEYRFMQAGNVKEMNWPYAGFVYLNDKNQVVYLLDVLND